MTQSFNEISDLEAQNILLSEGLDILIINKKIYHKI
jgi:hypothetical protein